MSTSFENYALPRTVPAKIKLGVFFGQVPTLIGLIFTLIGLVFLFVFIPLADFSSLSYNDNDPSAKGVIKSVISTGSTENKRRVYCYAFHYWLADGKTFEGVSYSTIYPQPEAGDTITVQYMPGKPEQARISGMRSSPFSPAVAFVFVFPLLGLVMLVGGIFRARKNIRLLANGMLVYGEVTGKEPTNTKINNRRVYKIFFRFTVNGTPYTSTVRTHKPERVLDEKKEPLLYNPDKPEEAVLVDAMPKAARGFLLG